MSTAFEPTIQSGIGHRELAHRSNNGREVTLLWEPSADALVVCVCDPARGAYFEIAALSTISRSTSLTSLGVRRLQRPQIRGRAARCLADEAKGEPMAAATLAVRPIWPERSLRRSASEAAAELSGLGTDAADRCHRNRSYFGRQNSSSKSQAQVVCARQATMEVLDLSSAKGG
jgi:hypothetical protein